MSTTEPPFVLCGPTGALVADGVQACYRDVADAQTALRSGTIPIVVGALAFDIDSPAALMAPRSVRRTAGLPDWPTDPLPTVQVAGRFPRPRSTAPGFDARANS